MNSKHWTEERKVRKEMIRKIGIGTIIKEVVIDRGHINGPEIHKITNTGIIIIVNEKSGKMITQLIARPQQIKRYYKENESVPEKVIKLAREHQKMNFNNL